MCPLMHSRHVKLSCQKSKQKNKNKIKNPLEDVLGVGGTLLAVCTVFYTASINAL